MILTRDIRLTADQILAARDACRHRRKELQRRLRRNSYEGKPGMKQRVLNELAEVQGLENGFEHHRQQLARQLATHVLGDDS